MIAASTNDMGPYSLDHFRKNNFSASWKINGQEVTVDGISEVGLAFPSLLCIYDVVHSSCFTFSLLVLIIPLCFVLLTGL